MKSLEGNQREIEDRFYKELEFGTGGLRGVLGAGSNRMNIYTVRKATQGLANYIISQGAQERGVVIAYDSRHMSEEFSEEAALCLNANGICTWRFPSLRPTPELSFAVRKLGCIAGIVITASHNPPEYNGYKVYWEDGAQITAPKDREIIQCVEQIEDISIVKTMEREEAEREGLYQIVDESVDDYYIEEIKKMVIHPESIRKMAEDVRIVYTPLHGAGRVPVERILNELGFKNVYVVHEQEMPNGDFPTVAYPNPEDPAVFDFAIALAKKVHADLILATDPDADRLGVYGKDSQTGEYHMFTGNMSGVLIADYLLSQKKRVGALPKNGAIVKTIVTTNMVDKMAEEYGVSVIEVLTGFKYIGEKIKEFEENGNHTFLFGFEESYGALTGTYARDKDAVGAVAALCEATAFYKEKGITIWDQMKKLYEKYGYYKERLETETLKGIDGLEQIKKRMVELRDCPPEYVDGKKVLKIRDYKNNQIKNLVTGEITETGLPKSDVLYFELEEDCWWCVRPSGTEPKIKYYYGKCENR